MTRPDGAPPRAVLVALIGAFTALLAALVPSVVIAAKMQNAFMVGFILVAAVVLVLLDGVALGVMIRAGKR